MKTVARAASIAIAFYCGVAAAQSAAEKQRLQALDKRCHDAREAKLKVLRAEKVEECIRVDQKSRADCEKWIESGVRLGRAYRKRRNDAALLPRHSGVSRGAESLAGLRAVSPLDPPYMGDRQASLAFIPYFR